jgi:hypothetical protein
MNNLDKRAKGRPSETKIPIVVVYKKPNGKKHILQSFENVELDSILNSNLRKPIISNEFELVDIGIGASFIERYKKQYKIK